MDDTRNFEFIYQIIISISQRIAKSIARELKWAREDGTFEGEILDGGIFLETFWMLLWRLDFFVAAYQVPELRKDLFDYIVEEMYDDTAMQDNRVRGYLDLVLNERIATYAAFAAPTWEVNQGGVINAFLNLLALLHTKGEIYPAALPATGIRAKPQLLRILKDIHEQSVVRWEIFFGSLTKELLTYSTDIRRLDEKELEKAYDKGLKQSDLMLEDWEKRHGL